MTKEGWCSNPRDGIDLSKGKIRDERVYGERRSSDVVEDVLIAKSIRRIEKRGGVVSWKVHQ